METEYLAHHGILGQKWGVRRYQNPDGSLTPRGKKHMQRKDDRWVRRNADRIQTKAFRQSRREMRRFTRKLDRQYVVKGRTYMNEYNRKLAEVMNTKVSDITSPSGRAVKFIAKRGEYGVMMALADQGYDMRQVKNGVWTNGKVAYKSTVLRKS